MVVYIRKLLFTLTILISIAVFISNGYAPEPKDFKIHVNVVAKNEDEIERIIIESHLKREFRALGNVVIVNEKDDWEYRFLVNIHNIKLIDGRRDSWVSIASVFNARVPKDIFNTYTYVSPHIPVLTYTPIPSHWPNDNLPAWCILQANGLDRILKAELAVRKNLGVK